MKPATGINSFPHQPFGASTSVQARQFTASRQTSGHDSDAARNKSVTQFHQAPLTITCHGSRHIAHAVPHRDWYHRCPDYRGHEPVHDSPRKEPIGYRAIAIRTEGPALMPAQYTSVTRSFEAQARMNHGMPAMASGVIPMESVASACSTIPYVCREHPHREHPAAQVPLVTGSDEQWRV